MATSQPAVAIFGATGRVGKQVARAILDPKSRDNYKDVLLFTRQAANLTPELEVWQKSGRAKVVQIGQGVAELNEQLAGVDVVVNTIGSEGDPLRKQVAQAIAGTNVKLYIPSEFGVDHTIHDFQHPEWDKKKAHFELANATLKDTKICRIYCGLFLEDSIGPWFGFDTKNSIYESYGSAHEKVAFTSLGDAGRIVATLVLMPPDQIPSQLHFCGDICSMSDIAEIMKTAGGNEIRIVEQPLQDSRTKELKAARPDPSGCLRFLMGEGKIKHTPDALGCDNDFVNPKEGMWKWKTMTDLAEETGGRPWADATWL